MVELPPAPSANAHEQLRPRLIRHILPFIELGDQAGVDVDGLLAAVGLTRRALRSPMTQLPYYQIHWLLEQLAERSGDPEFGLRAGERTLFVRAEFLGNLISHFIRSSTDLLAVMQLFAHFGTHVARTASISLRVEDSIVTVTIVPVVEAPAVLYDCMTGAACALMEAVGGPDVRPMQVRMPRPCPPRPERYEKAFGAPIVFDAPRWEFDYARETLRGRVLRDTSGPSPASALAAPTPQSGNALAMQIRTHLLARLAEGVPLLASVARKLGLSARTLRRRLSDIRSSYAELVDEARRERALSLATRADVDVGRLAELTGFTDASAFARAFRRWTGERPRDYMRRARQRVGT